MMEGSNNFLGTEVGETFFQLAFVSSVRNRHFENNNLDIDMLLKLGMVELDKILKNEFLLGTLRFDEHLLSFHDMTAPQWPNRSAA